MDEIKAGKQLKKTNSQHALELAAAPRPPPQDSLQAQILTAQLVDVPSIHKTVWQFAIPSPCDHLKNPRPEPRVAPPPPPEPVPEPKAKEASVPNDGRPIAPYVDANGPIAEWKRKIMQKKLDVEWVRVVSTIVSLSDCSPGGETSQDQRGEAKGSEVGGCSCVEACDDGKEGSRARYVC
jgi:hypothetical protein